VPGADPSGKGVRNGTRASSRRSTPLSREVTLATSDGRMLRLPADYVKRSTDYGYAWTLHKGQGQTVGQPSGATRMKWHDAGVARSSSARRA